MLFTDLDFLLRFLPGLLAVYFLVVGVRRAGRGGSQNAAAANGVLLAGAVVFFVVGAGRFAWVLGSAVVINLLAGWGIQRARDRTSGGAGTIPEALLTIAVSGNLMLFGAFKFAYPLASASAGLALAQPMSGPGLDVQGLAVPQLLMPFGLTLFVCHAVSYVVDVYRRHTRQDGSVTHDALYLLLFPFAVAGPIIRYRDIGAQLVERQVGMAAFSFGVRRFAVGWGKTFLLAGTLAGPADAIFATPAGALSPLAAWVGALCVGLRVYFELSGYADMALGLGRMFGFRLPENFRWPYAADTLHEFWRRWNVSLTAWVGSYASLRLDDLGRPRLAGTARRVLGLFLLIGLWHAPGWNVVRWAIFHGVVVLLERIGLESTLRRVPVSIRHAYVMLVVLVGWVIFRAETVQSTGAFLGTMFGLSDVPAQILVLPLDTAAWLAVAVGAIGSVPLLPWLSRWVVTVDAMATSGLMLVGTAVVFVWRTTLRLLEALSPRP